MAVNDYAAFNASATRLVWADGDPPTYAPETPPVVFPVLVLEMGAEERIRVGKESAREVVKVFCNLNPDRSLPATEEDEIEVTGWGRYGVFSAVRIMAEGEKIGILMGEKS